MVKIRYTDLGDGQHACSRPEGRHIVIYVQNGLTRRERNAALRRERYRLAVPVLQQGRHTRPAALRAVRTPFAASRARRRSAQAGVTAAAHPAWLTAGLLATAGVCAVLVVFTAATLTIRHFTGGAPAHHHGQAGAAAAARPPARTARYARPPAVPVPAGSGRRSPAPSASTARTPTPAPAPAAGGAGGGTGVTVRTPVLSATVTVSPGPLLPVQASAGPAGVCVHAGPLGVCATPPPLPVPLPTVVLP